MQKPAVGQVCTTYIYDQYRINYKQSLYNLLCSFYSGLFLGLMVFVFALFPVKLRLNLLQNECKICKITPVGTMPAGKSKKYFHLLSGKPNNKLKSLT